MYVWISLAKLVCQSFSLNYAYVAYDELCSPYMIYEPSNKT